MKCPRCESTSYRKNGHRKGLQNYLCKNCGRQFLEPSVEESLPTSESNSVSVSSDELPEPSLTDSEILTAGEDAQAEDTAAIAAVEEIFSTLPTNELVFPQVDETNVEQIEQRGKSDNGIGVLLLDAENIKLDVNTEKFLQSIVSYPLQVKIAFANWRNPTIGKQDAELYERGYQLVHVPFGKDSADAKMIALGSSIFVQYQNIKEVFVCSGDWILTHLCNELQNRGLTVYWVRRQDNNLSIENRSTGDFRYYSVPLATEVPSLEKLFAKVEELIRAEHKAIGDRLTQLSIVATLFQDRRNIDQANKKLDTVNGNSSNGSSAIASDSAVVSSAQDGNKDVTPIITTTINSGEELETALVGIIQKLTDNSPDTYVSMSDMSAELHKISGQPARLILKQLKLGAGLTKFLESCQSFDLKKIGKQYEVAIKTSTDKTLE